MASYPIPIIREEDLPSLSPVVFGFPVEWRPYASEVDTRCRKIVEAGDEAFVVAISSDRYLAWCAVNRIGPNSPVTLDWYASYRFEEGECYEYISGIDILLRTAELDDLAERMSMTAIGPEEAQEVLDAAQANGERLVRTAGQALPADGWIRVWHPGAPSPAGEWFDAVSSGVDDGESFSQDAFELLCSHATITCLTGGSFAAEQLFRRQLGYVIWRVTSGVVEGLVGPEGAEFVAMHPDAISEGVLATKSLDAPEELDPL